ncbi:hypothetical protein C8R47DRAFT_1221423 [Mycena vitilis]|nr:hypothetical protein C8R47DRAFT_1221423 [Mycena vitilis]
MEQSISDPPLPQPSASFLQAQTQYDAQSLLGSFTHELDYQLCLTVPETTGTGNNFVYKSRADNRPLRAFVLGTVWGMEVHKNTASQNTVSEHVSLRHLARGTDKAKTFFHNDVFTLRATIEAEASKNSAVARQWCVADDQQESNSTIYVECSYAAKRVPRSFILGSNVAMDVSLHRRDLRVEGVLTRSYYVVAHEIEIISREQLELAGLLEVE